jgi:uncharacterized protein (DUF433 family)
MNWKDYITTNPATMFGKPVVKGTRVPVDLLLEKLGNGETIDYLLEAYPRVSREVLMACLLFASETVKNELVYA